MAAALEQHGQQPRTPAGHLLYKADGRTPMFYAQGLARIGKAIGPQRRFWEHWQPRFTEVEDRIGGYDYWHDIADSSAGWNAPIEH